MLLHKKISMAVVMVMLLALGVAIGQHNYEDPEEKKAASALTMEAVNMAERSGDLRVLGVVYLLSRSMEVAPQETREWMMFHMGNGLRTLNAEDRKRLEENAAGFRYLRALGQYPPKPVKINAFPSPPQE